MINNTIKDRIESASALARSMIEIPMWRYECLSKLEERVEVVKEYIKNEAYPQAEMISLILGFEPKDSGYETVADILKSFGLYSCDENNKEDNENYTQEDEE